jgi:hypothetical protein
LPSPRTAASRWVALGRPGDQDRPAGRRSGVGPDHQSLERLQTDHLDLIQVHAVGDLAELDLVTGPGGSLEAVVRARDEGWRVRSGSPARAFTSNRATTPEAFSVASEIMTGTGRLGAARSQGRWPARWRDGEYTTNHRPTRNTGYPADVPANRRTPLGMCCTQRAPSGPQPLGELGAVAARSEHRRSRRPCHPRATRSGRQGYAADNDGHSHRAAELGAGR